MPSSILAVPQQFYTQVRLARLQFYRCDVALPSSCLQHKTSHVSLGSESRHARQRVMSRAAIFAVAFCYLHHTTQHVTHSNAS